MNNSPMKLILDPSCYKSVKPALALALTTGERDLVVVEKVTGTRCPWPSRRLPVLEINQDVTLFSENVICSFLQCDSGHDDDVATWMEWESVTLQPVLSPVVTHAWGGSKVSDLILQKCKGLLVHLNSWLSERQYLTGRALSVADVVVWSSLYPLASVEDSVATYFANAPHVLKWFKRLAQLPTFVEVISRLTKGEGAKFFKSSFLRYADVSTIANKCDVTLENGFVEPDAIPDQKVDVTQKELDAGYEWWLRGRQLVPKLKNRTHPILPQSGERNIMITSSLPYVNNVPHLGNIIGCVLSADVFARYCRARNYNTLYICGTDEYGTATETKAIEEGVTPQEICDKYFKLHAQIYEWFEISFDHFGRTTTPQQTKIAHKLFWQLYRNNYILEDSVDQLLCTKCNRFLADRFVEGICPFCAYEDARGDQCDKCGKLINAVELKAPRCKLCQTEPKRKSSKHLFLDLPKLSVKLGGWFENIQRKGNFSQSAVAITKTWLRDGLKPRCITRDLEWGVSVPLEGYTSKVFYVWFDAPVGYPSITANYTENWEMWWKNPDHVKLYQFMAKDNVPFHSVIFPACLLGANDGYTVINSLSAIEYLNYEDGKFSKSRGIGVFGNDAQDTGIPADIWRFYLLYVRPETQDSAFSWQDLMTKNNGELLNNLGNFINRSLSFLCNFFEGAVQPMDVLDEDKLFVALINRELQSYIAVLENLRLRDAIRHILNISRLGNQYFQNQKPWVQVKGSDSERQRAGSIIGLCANVCCLLSVMLEPYMPTTARAIQEQLNVSAENVGTLPDNLVCYLPAGHKIGKAIPLFRKIEAKEIEVFRIRFAGKQSTRENSPSGIVTETLPQSSNCIKVDMQQLNTEIAKQGELVRNLKSKEADKTVIDAEVAKLLELKKRLSLATGQDAVPVKGQKKKKQQPN